MAQTNNYGKKPLWQWAIIYLIVGGLVYGLIYYFVLAKNSSYNNSSVGYPQSVSSSEQNRVTPIAAAAIQVTVTGNEFAFNPPTITAQVGRRIDITFKNEGKYPHNLVISDLNMQTRTIKPGEQDTVTLIPSKAGSYPFFCSVPGHADRGMRGVLEVQ